MRDKLCGWLFLIILGQSLVVHAEPLELVVQTDPSGAILRDQYGNALGRSGQPFVLEWDRDKGALQLQIVQEGYKTVSRTLSYRELSAGTYPEDGPIALPPDSLRAKTSVHLRGKWPILVLVPLIGFLTWRNRKKIPSAPEKTETVGRYELLDRLGQGGTSVVYRAAASDDPQAIPVALKLLHEEHQLPDQTRSRFEREVQAALKLKHPNLAQIYDWGEHKGRPYLVCELLEGETLRQQLGGPKLPLERVQSVVKSVAAALGYLHQEGYVHRDVKPDNIFLTEKGVIKLVDLGIVQSEDMAPLTQDGTAMGTPHYMAPEQARGQAVPATDQYALGVTVFEMLVGQRPYRGSDGMAILQQHQRAPIPSVLEHRPELSPLLQNALEKAMAKSPESRYRNIEDCARAISTALNADGGQGLETGAVPVC